MRFGARFKVGVGTVLALGGPAHSLSIDLATRTLYSAARNCGRGSCIQGRAWRDAPRLGSEAWGGAGAGAGVSSAAGGKSKIGERWLQR